MQGGMAAERVVDLYIDLSAKWPGEARVPQNLALFLMLQGEFAAAIATIDVALSFGEDPVSYFIKGRALDETLDFARSIDCYRHCLRLDATDGRAKFYLSLASLSLGDFDQGTRFYPHRLPPEQAARFASVAPWSPDAPRGRVLIWAEQGIGDEVMFLQLLHLAEELDFAFTVECDPRLISLFRANFPDIAFVARNGPIDAGAFDYQVAMGDLLGFFHRPLREGRLWRPSLVPVPRADVAARVAQVKRGRKLVGLSWFSVNEEYGLRRTVPVETLCRALDPKRHAIAILQYLPQDEDLATLRDRGFDCIADVDGFNDIEAVMALIGACDAVVSIDNSVAHFAGAVGVETHLLLPALPNWRWGVSGERSYWYPNMRLHRRAPGIGWDGVVDAIPLG